MSLAMWQKALKVIPEVSKSEWHQLDLVSKWLISTRAAVLIMTFVSAALAGFFAQLLISASHHLLDAQLVIMARCTLRAAN